MALAMKNVLLCYHQNLTSVLCETFLPGIRNFDNICRGLSILREMANSDILKESGTHAKSLQFKIQMHVSFRQKAGLNTQ